MLTYKTLAEAQADAAAINGALAQGIAISINGEFVDPNHAPLIVHSAHFGFPA